jgi:hypothetical protein
LCFNKLDLILRRPPTGPRKARPDDRLRGRLEGWAAVLIYDFRYQTRGV